MDSSFENEVRLETVMPLIMECIKNGQNVKFSPKGTSMLPMLRQGLDTVTLGPLPEKLKRYDLPLYQRDNGQYVLHRIIRAGETVTCIGDNQFEPESGIRYDQMIAVVTAFSRNEQNYFVGDFRYRVYCRIWHYSRPVRYLWRRGKNWLRRLLK